MSDEERRSEMASEGRSNRRVAFKRGFLTDDLADLDATRLVGSRCNVCGVVLLGHRRRCENCSSRDLTASVFGNLGTVFSYTIQRYPPPRPHAGPDPWIVRALAWVDIDAGPRVLAPVTAAPQEMAIGMRVRLLCEVGWLDAAGSEVISYRCVPMGSTER